MTAILSSPEESGRIFSAAMEPKRIWRVTAANHRFGDNLAELDRSLEQALAWIRNG